MPTSATRSGSITQRSGGRLTYHLYTYKCGNSYTPSFFMQQATIFFNGLLNRYAAGALIRFTVPVESSDLDDATSLRRLQTDAFRLSEKI